MIGRCRIRTRASSNTTMAPSSRSAASRSRWPSSSVACAWGRRGRSRRNRISGRLGGGVPGASSDAEVGVSRARGSTRPLRRIRGRSRSSARLSPSWAVWTTSWPAVVEQLGEPGREVLVEERTSRGRGERQRPFTHRLGGVEQRHPDVLGLEVGEVGENLARRSCRRRPSPRQSPPAFGARGCTASRPSCSGSTVIRSKDITVRVRRQARATADISCTAETTIHHLVSRIANTAFEQRGTRLQRRCGDGARVDGVDADDGGGVGRLPP